MKNQIAYYLRLSLEDLDKRTNKVKDESNSISAQRELINRHLDQNPMLCKLPRLEFCDDGFSGTSFDRPDFQRMLEAAKCGEISCIVVKDLSRFGRDYLEVGDYLEHIFPFLGIRFKSINDHYDSETHQGQTIGMDVAFKNLIYDYYSKDLSKKVRTAHRMKQKEARFVCTPPFGYKVSQSDKHQLVIDDEAAPIVRWIFLAAIGGKKTTQIARELNERGVPTRHQSKGISRNGHTRDIWTHRNILEVLGNLKYTGTMVNHTKERYSVSDKRERRVPKEEWYTRENAHPAIVSSEEYELAQAAIRRRPKSHNRKHDQSDRVYYCAHCGAKLSKDNGTMFSCESSRFRTESPCDHVHFPKVEIEEVLLAALKKQIQVTKVITDSPRGKAKKELETGLQKCSSMKAKISSIDREKISLYESYREGKISADDYRKTKREMDEEKESLNKQLEIAEERMKQNQSAYDAALVQNISVGRFDGLSDTQLKEHLYDAVERINVFSRSEIDIIWKFDEVIDYRTPT